MALSWRASFSCFHNWLLPRFSLNYSQSNLSINRLFLNKARVILMTYKWKHVTFPLKLFQWLPICCWKQNPNLCHSPQALPHWSPLTVLWPPSCSPVLLSDPSASGPLHLLYQSPGILVPETSVSFLSSLLYVSVQMAFSFEASHTRHSIYCLFAQECKLYNAGILHSSLLYP